MSDTLISIIVPIYKVEPYIRRCIESIIAQTLQQIEVFLVDDGSPDHCGAICDEYAKTDNRITVIHKKNAGQSSARNAALNVANGKYLMFVDGDDWVEPDFCKTALRLALENNAQVVSFGFNLVFVDKNGKLTGKKKKVPPKAGFMEASEAVRHLLLGDIALNNYVCNKLFSLSLWGDARFPEGKVWEDQSITYLMIIKAERVYISDVILYNYIQRHDSTMSLIVTPSAIVDKFTIWKDRLPIICQYCPENAHLQIMQIGRESVLGFIYIPPESEYGEVLSKMGSFLSNHREELLHGCGKFSTKVMLWIYYYCRPLLFLHRYARSAIHLLKR